MPFAQGHALLVGVGTYEHTPERNVLVTARDAEAVERVLRDPHRCGYPERQVKVLTRDQAKREAVLSELDKLAGLRPADTVLFFYAGHGEYDAQGRYYLTCHDTRLQD